MLNAEHVRGAQPRIRPADYRLEMADGRRFWICRAGGPDAGGSGGGGWFLHGLMP